MRFPPSTTVLLLWSVFAFAVNSATADTASRLYEQGRYQEAFERFKKAAAGAKDNWPLFYDLGAAAYKAGQFGDAAEAFQKAMGSPDAQLQAKSLYNLGNTYYRVGEASEKQAPDKAIPIYQQALKTFENAIAADPKDADAKFNRDAVKKKLEELEKQHQQQQQQKQDQKNDQQKKEQEKHDQKQDESKHDQNQNQQGQNQQQPQQNNEKKDQQNQGQQKQDQKQGQQGKDQKPQEQPSAGGETNRLDKLEAQMLLDNLREEERNWNFFPEAQMKDLKDSGPPSKDW